jgi:hypothetical protein
VADGSLDPVAFLVDFGVEGAISVHAGSLRDDRDGADRLDMVEDGVSVIGLVGDDVPWPQAGNERERMGGVTGLAAGEDEADRPAQRVDRDVPLARQSASGAPQSLVFAPPF